MGVRHCEEEDTNPPRNGIHSYPSYFYPTHLRHQLLPSEASLHKEARGGCSPAGTRQTGLRRKPFMPAASRISIRRLWVYAIVRRRTRILLIVAYTHTLLILILLVASINCFPRRPACIKRSEVGVAQLTLDRQASEGSRLCLRRAE